MRPRKASNSFKERLNARAMGASPKRRITLAQVLLGGGGGDKNRQQGSEATMSKTGPAVPNFASAVGIRGGNTVSHQSKGPKDPDKKKRKSIVALFQQAQQQPQSETAMRPKVMHVLVMGPKKAGKTALLRTLAEHSPGPGTSSMSNEEYKPTLEDDTYHIQLHNDQRHPRDLVLFHDTAGIPGFGTIELKRSHLQAADAFLLVFSVLDSESFNRMDVLKKQLDREKFGASKDKREIPIIAIGTKVDLPGRRVDPEFALHWANKERVKLFETSTLDRDSIVDIIHHLSGKFFNREAKFSLSRRLKPEKSNAQIVMDF